MTSQSSQAWVGEDSDPGEGVDPAGELGAPSVAAACEAVLLVAAEPVDLLTLAGLLGRPAAEVAQVLAALSQQYTAEGRGFDLRESGGGWRLYTRADCAAVVARFATDGQLAKLSQAALETLAIIAYRQPESRARISAVRGVNVDGVVRTLITRGLVAESGVDAETRASLLVTTPHFLTALGIANLNDLPGLAEHVPSYEQLGELADLA